MYVPHTYEWVIASINRPTWHRPNESRVCIVSLCMYVCMYVPHIYEWVMARILSCTWHREDMPYECNAVISLTRIGLYVWYDSFMCATWLVYMYDVTHWSMRQDAPTCATALMHLCDTTRPHVWQDVSYLQRDSFMCNMTYSCGVASTSRLLKMISLFGRISSLL